MPLDRGLFDRLDVPGAVAGELEAGNRLLPRRFDDHVLARDIEAVVSWVKPRVRRGQLGGREDVVLARKGWRGLRPLSVLSLTDRVAYRALVSLMAESLPEQVRSRGSNDDFRKAPLDVDGTKYVLQADVASFFQFVDHETLGDELLAQTGEEPAVDALLGLLGLLGGVSGRRVGIPQISAPSDVLGDVYADPVRRELARAGFAVFRYADDFRVACPSLGSALRALEACDTAARALGLTLNERKTLTFGRRRYERALDAFARREAELFDDESGDGADLAALEGPYGDGTASAEDVDAALGLTAGERLCWTMRTPSSRRRTATKARAGGWPSRRRGRWSSGLTRTRARTSSPHRTPRSLRAFCRGLCSCWAAQETPTRCPTCS